MKRCEPCDGYVEPDGEWVDRREGRLRYAVALTRSEPKTVAELYDALLADPLPDDDEATLRAELVELCDRHRRLRPPRRPDWLSVEPLAVKSPGYRESGGAHGFRIEVTHPRSRAARLTLPVLGAGLAAAGTLGLVGAAFGLLVGAGTLFVSGQLALHAHHVRTLAPPLKMRREDGNGRLVLEAPKQVSAPLAHVRLRLWQQPTRNNFVLWRVTLDAPSAEVLLLRHQAHATARELVIQLEHVLGLDAPPYR